QPDRPDIEDVRMAADGDLLRLVPVFGGGRRGGGGGPGALPREGGSGGGGAPQRGSPRALALGLAPGAPNTCGRASAVSSGRQPACFCSVLRQATPHLSACVRFSAPHGCALLPLRRSHAVRQFNNSGKLLASSP